MSVTSPATISLAGPDRRLERPELPACLPARCPRSPLDPAGLLHRAFVAEPGRGDGGGAAAEDTLIAWLMSLPPEVEPAEAARRMVDARLEIARLEIARLEIARLEGEQPIDADAESRRLMALLEETARWPGERLVRTRLGGSRRRRRSDRRC